MLEMQKVQRKIKTITIRDIKTILISDFVFELDDDEILLIKDSSPEYRLTKVYNIINDLKTPVQPFCYEVHKQKDRFFLKIAEIKDNILFDHYVTKDLLDLSDEGADRYGISNICFPDKVNESKIRICYFPPDVPNYSTIRLYNSLEELKKHSPEYKSLSDEEKSWVCEPKNFTTVKDTIFSQNFNNWNNTAKFLKHLYLGDIKNGKFSGIHHIYALLKDRARLIEVINYPNRQGVWRGKLQLKDNRHFDNGKINKWKSKSEISTFFPNQWSNVRLIEECIFAFENRELILRNQYSNKYKSNTKSGIEVIIFTDKDENLLTIYPDWNDK
jgi:hypothetical protein